MAREEMVALRDGLVAAAGRLVREGVRSEMERDLDPRSHDWGNRYRYRQTFQVQQCRSCPLRGARGENMEGTNQDGWAYKPGPLLHNKTSASVYTHQYVVQLVSDFLRKVRIKFKDKVPHLIHRLRAAWHSSCLHIPASTLGQCTWSARGLHLLEQVLYFAPP